MDFFTLCKQQWLQLFERIPMALCLLNAELQPVLFNRAAAAWLEAAAGAGGHAVTGAGNGRPRWFEWLRTADGRPYALEEPLTRALRTGRPWAERDLRFGGSDSGHAVHLDVLPLRGEDGLGAGLLLALQEVPESRAELAETALLEARIAELERFMDQDRDRLRAVSRRFIEIQESERRHLARELHDEISQALTALKIHLQTLPAAMAQSDQRGEVEARVAPAIAILDRLMGQVRNLSLDLRPSMLDDLGLEAALRWVADRRQVASGVIVDLSVDYPPGGCGGELDMTCFRVVQEALTNVVRHARASRVAIRLAADAEARTVRLAIADDGAGFDREQARRQGLAGKALGLMGMEERVNLLGGSLEIITGAGRGTRIEVTLPIPAPVTAEAGPLGPGEKQ